MRVFHRLDEITRYLSRAQGERSAVAIGNFDGVHLGHRALLGSTLAEARERKSLPVVLTFYPHPVEVLIPGTRLQRLTTTEEKLAQLEAVGVELVLVATFDRDLAALTAEQFFTRFLVDGLRASSCHVGFNFHFGHKRSGNTEVLAKLCEARGIGLRVQEPFTMSGVKVDSTGIRKRIVDGDIVAAAHWLGRPYSIAGRVAHGDHRGTGLGFPTANVHFPWDKVLPRHGVYLTRARWQRQCYRSVTNVGVRPTFAGGDARVETHLLDFSARLYDEPLEVEFLARLRDEKKFASLDELKAQIRADVEAARNASVFTEGEARK